LVGLALVVSAVVKLRLNPRRAGSQHHGLTDRSSSQQDAGQHPRYGGHADLLALIDALGQVSGRDVADLVADDGCQLIHILRDFYKACKDEDMPPRCRKGIEGIVPQQIEPKGEGPGLNRAQEIVAQVVDEIVGELILQEDEALPDLSEHFLPKFSLVFEGKGPGVAWREKANSGKSAQKKTRQQNEND
jgi:hypothetical protein